MTVKKTMDEKIYQNYQLSFLLALGSFFLPLLYISLELVPKNKIALSCIILYSVSIIINGILFYFNYKLKKNICINHSYVLQKKRLQNALALNCIMIYLILSIGGVLLSLYLTIQKISDFIFYLTLIVSSIGSLILLIFMVKLCLKKNFQ